MSTKNFIVTSHGWSASNWTAHSLNLNNDVTCTHSARNVLANDVEIQSNQNLKQNINQLQTGYVSRQNRSLDELYDQIENLGETEAYGSVHVLRLRDLPVINLAFGEPNRNFKIANIVRHPVDLVWSGYGQFKDLFRYDINELYWTTGKVVKQALNFANFLGDKYKLNIGDYDVLGFLGACAVLESLKKDIDALDQLSFPKKLDFQGNFKMEAITNSKVEFNQFCDSLGLEKFVNEAYLNKVFETGLVNKHRHDSVKLMPAERYSQFTEWQKEAFLYFFEMHNIRESYESFGYSFDFLT